MCLSVMRFFSLQVFPILITVTGLHSFFDVLILFIYSNLLVLRLLHSRIRAGVFLSQ